MVINSYTLAFAEENQPEKQMKIVFTNLAKHGGYDAMQGGCTDGKYAYYAMNRHQNDKSIIIKVRLSDWTIVKKSKSIKAHLNSLTYNPKTNRIVGTKGTGKKLIIINPHTLSMRTKTVSIPKKLSGATKIQRNKISAFTSIAFDSKRNRYIAVTKKNYDFVILNSRFKPIKYAKRSYGKIDTSQDIYIDGDRLMCCFSKKFGFKSNYSKSNDFNYIRYYDVKSLKYINSKKLPDGHELENIFKVNSIWYAGFYYPYYKFKSGNNWVKRNLIFYKKSKKYYERYYNTTTKKSYWTNPVYRINMTL